LILVGVAVVAVVGKEFDEEGVGLTNREGRTPIEVEVIEALLVDVVLLFDRNMIRREGKADSDNEGRGAGLPLFKSGEGGVLEGEREAAI
jgi:hypothetical protein